MRMIGAASASEAQEVLRNRRRVSVFEAFMRGLLSDGKGEWGEAEPPG